MMSQWVNYWNHFGKLEDLLQEANDIKDLTDYRMSFEIIKDMEHTIMYKVSGNKHTKIYYYNELVKLWALRFGLVRQR